MNIRHLAQVIEAGGNGSGCDPEQAALNGKKCGRPKSKVNKQIEDITDKLGTHVLEYDKKMQEKPGYNKWVMAQYLFAVHDIENGVPPKKAIEDNFYGSVRNHLLKQMGYKTIKS